MKFLIDQALSPRLASLLTDHGFFAAHVRDLGMAKATDEQILSYAAEKDLVLISADTDFGTLLATSKLTKPSVILFRREASRKADQQIGLLVANLDSFASALTEGSIVVIHDEVVRIRKLPIIP